MSRNSWLIGIILGIALFYGYSPARAQVPGGFTYQGFLEENGAPVSNGNVTLTISISDQANNLLFTEVLPNVIVTDGIFNVVIGGTLPFPATMDFNSQYSMQVEVATTSSGSVTLPPVVLYAVPYAINSRMVNGLQASPVPVAGELYPVPIGTGYTDSVKMDPAFLPSGIPNDLLATPDITTINGVSPGPTGNFQINAGNGITIVPGTNEITIGTSGQGTSVTSVTNSDGTITASPTTGNVVVSLALGHANTWTATQTLPATNAQGSALANSINNATTTLINGSKISGNIPGNATNLTGTVSVANGGTGLTIVPAHSVLMGEGTNVMATTTPSNAGYVLTSNGPSADPSWQAVNQGVTSVSTVGSDGSLSISPTTGNVVASIDLSHANDWLATQTFPATDAQGSALANSINNATTTLIDGSKISGNIPGDAANVTGTVDVAHGGTGQTSYTNGQLLIGNTTGNTLTVGTLTQGSGISIVNGNGTITIASTGAPPSGTAGGDLTGTYPNPTITNTSTAGRDIIAALTVNGGTLTNNTSGNAATAATATSFSGNLSGDVTGTQSATTVAKINGNPLGATTETAGNYLRSNGADWVSSGIQAGDVPTLNQNTTGTASGFTGNLSGDVTGTQSATVVGKLNGNTVPANAAGVLTNNGSGTLTWSPAATGTVTGVSVATANGFAGTSSGGATPQLTLTTTVSGMLKGSSNQIVAATSGTDYSAGTSGLATGILKSTAGTGALSIAGATDFPTLNQNTTGTASGFTGNLSGDVTGTQSATVVGKLNGNTVPANAAGVLTNNGSGTLTWSPAATGTVTGVSVATANGFAGTSSGGATPQLTLSTTVTGILYGNGTSVAAAAAGDFPTLNQNTTGTASGFTGTLSGDVTGTESATAIAPTAGNDIVAALNNGTPTSPIDVAAGGTGVSTVSGVNQFFANTAGGSSPAFRSIVPGDLPVATATALGVVEPDNTTIEISAGGVITAIGAAPSGAAGGDLTGTYPNPTIVDTAGNTIVTALNNVATTSPIDVAAGGTGATTLTSGDLLLGNGTSAVTAGPAWNSGSSTLTGNITGNAATAAAATSFSGNLSGDVTGTQSATVVGKLNGNTVPANAAGVLTNNGSGTLTWSPAATGTVTGVSVATANGFAGTSSGGATPQLTLTTTVTGILYGNGTSVAAAAAGDFPTLNQNTTGTASGFTGTLSGDVTGTQSATVVGKLNGNTVPANAAGVLTNNGSGTLTWSPAATGTVTGVSVATANGFAGTSSGGATPQLTLSTTVTGILYGNGTSVAAAAAGDFPTLNQNTTGTASGFTGNLSGDVTGTQSATVVGKLNGNTVPANAAGVLTNNGSGTLTWSPAATGTVTGVSVATANGFAGTSSGGATPQLTLTTTVSGMLKGSSNQIVAATSGTDYSAGTSGLATGILKSTAGTGALSIAGATDFPTLNQNTTGTASGFTGNLSGDVTGTQSATVVGKLNGNTVPANAAGVLTNNGSGTLTWSPAATGTVTGVSVATANGFAGTSSGGATPQLTLSTTVTGILYGNGTSVAAAAAGDFPTLNQNTTGTASGFTGTLSGDVTGTESATAIAPTAGNDIVAALNNGTPTSPIDVAAGGTGVSTVSGVNQFFANTAGGSSPAFRSIVPGDLPVATATALGVVEPDNTTIEISAGGVITAIGAAPSGAAGGDLTGTYPNPTIVDTAGNTIVTALNNVATTSPIDVAAGGTGATTLTSGDLLLGNGTSAVTAGPAWNSGSSTLTGNITGNAATAAAATSFSGNLSGDVTGTQSATVVGKLNGNTVPANAAGVLTNNGSGTLTWSPAATGTVTGVSVATANGFAGTSSGGATPQLTLTTTVTGILYGNGTSVAAAAAGDFPTLNQNTTGTASGFTGTLSGDVTGTQSATVVGKLNGNTVPANAAGVLTNNGSGTLTWSPAATGTVTGVSVATANGFAGTSSGGATPQLTLSTTVTGILYGNGTSVAAAAAGDFPTLNQNTTGTASGFTGNLSGDVTGTQSATVVGKLNGNTVPANAAGVLTNNGSGTLTWSPAATGTVTGVSVATANGFAGTSSGGATPQLTLTTTVSGMLKGSSNQIVAATSGTDYSAGTSGLATGILKSTAGTGALSIAGATDFPTLNQNTTGTASGFTGNLSGDVTGTQSATVVGKLNGNTVPANAAGVLTNNGSGTLTWSPAATGTVTGVSVATANGFAGTSSGGATPQLTLSTTVTGILYGNGTSVAAAAAGDFPTLNQNTTGTASGFTGTLSGDVTGTESATAIAPTAGNDIVAALNNGTPTSPIDVAAGGTGVSTVSGVNQFFANTASGSSPAFRSIVPGDLPVATATALGVVEPDNTTIEISAGGVITAIGAAPSGAAGGDLTGTYPNPTIVDTAGNTIVTALNNVATTSPIDVAAGGTGATTLTSGDLLLGNGTSAVTAGPAWNSGSSTLTGNITGNAATAAAATSFSGNLSGDVTGTQSATVVGKLNGNTVPANAAGVLTNNGSGTLTWSPAATGTVTGVSVATANGFAGTSSGGATPQLTLTTTVTGILYGNGTSVAAAAAGDFPTLNQNTTGTASGFTGTLSGDVTGTQSATVVGKLNGNTVPANAAGVLTNNGSGTLTWSPAATGTVTGVSVATANGFAGTSSGGATPQLTLSTTVTGILYGNGTSVAAAAAGDFPTLNQNTTGTASGFTGNLSGDVTGTQSATVVGKLNGNTVPANAAGVLTNNGSGTLTWSPAATGTVTGVSVATANGFAGTSSGGATPQLTLSTTVSGMLKGSSNQIVAATSGTDYSAGTSGLATGILKSTAGTGALSIAGATDFPTLNQNTTGTASGFTGNLSGDVTGTQSATVVGKLNGNTVPANAAGVLTNNGSGTLTWSPAATGTVTGVSVATANGFAGTSSGGATPQLTLSTTVTGILYGNGTSVAAAAAGDFPTLNQNTTGTASGFTGTLSGDVTGTESATAIAPTAGNDIVAALNNGTPTSPIDVAAGGTGVSTVSGVNQFFANTASGSSPAFRSIVPGDLPVATATALGVVEPDNTTIEISAGGVITAIGAAPSGAAGGDLTGTYPNPTIVDTAGNTIVTALNNVATTSPIDVAAGGTGATTLTSGDLLLGNGTSAVTAGPAWNSGSSTLTGNITGNAATAAAATSFSGNLSGDVTGTQSATTVAKINGNPLGATTETAGNYLRSNGADWVSSGIQAGDVPTLNQNTTGTASGFTGTLSGDVTGTESATVVGKLNGNTIPANAAGVLTNNGSGTLTWSPAATGTVTGVSVATANGFAGTSSGGATPQLTLSTTVTGILYGNGTSVAAAAAGDFPTLNQNTTGTASGFTGTLSGDVTGTESATVVGKLNGNTVPANAAGVLTNNGSGTLTWSPAATGTVTGVSVATANGFAGTSSGGATPQLTLSTTVTGILYGNGTSVAAAAAGDFPTLNQNTTGTAAGFTGNLSGDVTGTQSATAIAPTAGNDIIAALNNGTPTSPIDVAAGGTGLATIPAHSVLIGEGTGNIATSGAGTAGYVLTSNGNGSDPTWQAATGAVLSVANSDGSLTISPVTGNVVASLALGHANTWLATQTFPSASIANGELANSSVTVSPGTGMSGGGSVSLGGTITVTNAGVTSNVAGTGIGVSGATGAVTITNTGVTSLTAGTGISLSGSTGAVTVTSTGAAPTGAAGGDLGSTYPNPTVVSVADVTTGTLGVANGGTGATTLTSGDLLLGNGTSAVTAGPAWNSGSSTLTGNITGNAATAATATSFSGTLSGDVTGTQSATKIANTSAAGTDIIAALTANGGSLTNKASNVTGTVAIANGGTGSSATPTAGGVAYGNGSVYNFTAQGSPGDVLVSVGSGAPIWFGLVGGSGISITNSATADTIKVTGAPPTGAASGDLASSYPSPTIASTSAAGGDIIAALTANGGTLSNNTTGTAAAVPASAITGTTLASNVVSSSLTSVGTLTGLTVNGATNLDGGITSNISLATDANYPVTTSDYVIILPSISSARTVTLPSSPANGRIIVLVDNNGSSPYWSPSPSFVGIGGSTITTLATGQSYMLMYSSSNTTWYQIK